jgi:3-(3-hydroxy-phenyl)propionate hydroxylase
VDPLTAAPLTANDVDVAIVGAGPVGLIIANTLGAAGLRVMIIDALPSLIDYPRGVGMDDECLRAFQGIGLAEAILPHITHHQIMRLVNGKGRVFASIDPKTDEFGWPRRNAFIQPLIDRVLADGLTRYPQVSLLLGHSAQAISQDQQGVTVEAVDAAGAPRRIRASYLVGCDGGRSTVRRALIIPFEGKTNPNRWIVVDIANDPMGLPNAYLHADPRRPYACIALPHGIRRLEFMLFDDEGKDGEVPRDVLDKMLARVMPHPEKIDLIRARIYTHNGRLAAQFRKDRVVLAGDAAHIMPVWQGQGYNSGVRDAANLGWKLALVARGVCGDVLLDSYGAERREHAKAMISLSETVGTIFATRNPVAVLARDAFTYVANMIPSVKRYFLEMRFKPMPRYKQGAVYFGPKGFNPASPVGRMFIQPRVTTADGWIGRLDEVVGAGRFALITWGVSPAYGLSPETLAILEALGTTLIWIVPITQLGYEAERNPGVVVCGDTERRVKQWFDTYDNSAVLLRPDRFVAINCTPQEINEQVNMLASQIRVNTAGGTQNEDMRELAVVDPLPA